MHVHVWSFHLHVWLFLVVLKTINTFVVQFEQTLFPQTGVGIGGAAPAGVGTSQPVTCMIVVILCRECLMIIFFVATQFGSSPQFGVFGGMGTQRPQFGSGATMGGNSSQQMTSPTDGRYMRIYIHCMITFRRIF